VRSQTLNYLVQSAVGRSLSTISGVQRQFERPLRLTFPVAVCLNPLGEKMQRGTLDASSVQPPKKTTLFGSDFKTMGADAWASMNLAAGKHPPWNLKVDRRSSVPETVPNPRKLTPMHTQSPGSEASVIASGTRLLTPNGT